MTRNLKVLGLAITAMLMFGAMASMASAAEFHSEASSTTIKAEQSAEFGDQFITDAGAIKCKIAKYSGSQSGATSTETTVTPEYKECKGPLEVNVTVDVNGCTYRFTAVRAIDIKCPEGKVIEVTAPGCTTTIAPQNGINGVTFDNKVGPPRDIEVTIEANNIIYEEHNVGFFPTCKSNTVLTNNGQFKGKDTVRGFNGESQVGIWWE